jgi:UDP-N-acetylglucosamine diphosphorylase/glucosamine-1-phosphate N-acetyltransferase
MHLCLFEDAQVPGLRPLVESRAAYALRLGGRTLFQTASDAFAPIGVALHARPLVADVTRQRYPSASVNALPEGADVLFLNGRYVAAGGAAQQQLEAAPDQDEARAFVQGETLVAAWVPDAATALPDDVLARPALTAEAFGDLPVSELTDATLVRHPWDLLTTLRPALVRDVEARFGTAVSVPLADRPHAAVHDGVTGVHPERIHFGSEATAKPGAILNAENGHIYIGPEATVHEQAVVRGPCVLGPKTQVKIGANIEGTATGPWCKLAGEVHDTILQGYSNKSHPGFLGHAVLGRWCNLGADTNNSNLKNDYGEVSAYAPDEARFVDTGRQFAGLFMGDHSKSGINTMFNTGTVVGTNCNLYGGGFPPRYVPPFSWGGASGLTTYRLGNACAVAERVMARRDTDFTAADRSLLHRLFDRTEEERATHHA